MSKEFLDELMKVGNSGELCICCWLWAGFFPMHEIQVNAHGLRLWYRVPIHSRFSPQVSKNQYPRWCVPRSASSSSPSVPPKTCCVCSKGLLDVPAGKHNRYHGQKHLINDLHLLPHIPSSNLPSKILWLDVETIPTTSTTAAQVPRSPRSLSPSTTFLLPLKCCRLLPLLPFIS